jgi:hypothetical protein
MALIENKDVKFHFEMKNGDDEYVIVLDTPLLFSVGDSCYIIESGYRSNGMSVPHWLWSVISPQYSPVTLFPSICHDWLYDNHVVPRITADKWYHQALIENGYPKWKSKLVYDAVRIFGKSHWRPLQR